MNIQAVLKETKDDINKVFLDDKVNDTIRFFSEKKCKAAVAVDKKHALCGIVTEHDLVRCLGENGEAAADEKVEDIMSLDLVVCTPETSILDAIKLMSEYKIHHLPVVSESGHLVGFVNMMDVMVKFIDNK